MATVREVSDPYANFMLNPLTPGQGVCATCLTLTEKEFDKCYACDRQAEYADSVLPISYSVHGKQLHYALRMYKDSQDKTVTKKFRLELAAVLWRFVRLHESCLAQRVGVECFDLVTTVPSFRAERNISHPLHRIVSKIVHPTADRYERLLVPSADAVRERIVDPDRFYTERRIDGSAVLLIDDTWTTGANAQSAAGTLKNVGATHVGVLVIGRHIHEDYKDNKQRLKKRSPYDWDKCPYH